MKSLLKYTLSLFSFWLLLFFCGRIFFVCYQLPIGNRIKQHADVFASFWKGYQLDFATAVILTLLPMLLLVIHSIYLLKLFKKISTQVVVFFILLYTFVAIGDAGIYKEWNAKINFQALAHFKNPTEIIEVVSWKLIILFFVLVTLFSIPFCFLYQKIIATISFIPTYSSIKKRAIVSLLFFCITTTLGVFIIRGGITNLPINQSVAYFSNDALANDIAVNPLYNLMQDFTVEKNIPDESIYKKRTNEEAKKIIADDFSIEKDSTIAILNNIKPNLVFIFLEGWSTDNLENFDGVKGCTPCFTNLCYEGLLFSKCYSNAYVSDQGIPAVLSAYPSVSRVSIIAQPDKIARLPCITEELINANYSTAFLYGGDLVFGNFKGYFKQKKINSLVEVSDLQKYPQASLGVQEEYTCKELLNILHQKQAPFMQGYFTLSTHMPYDFNSVDSWQSSADDVEKKYTESMHYADLQLGHFFSEAKKQAWYSNTLFILVSDHSHNSIKQWEGSLPERHHIPLLMIGGALKSEWQGQTWTKIVSQLDITSTLLHQLHIDASRYPWSRNMLNPSTPSSAYYIFYGGQGYINENGFVACPQLGNTSSKLTDTTQLKTLEAKATSFQQLIYEDVKNRK